MIDKIIYKFVKDPQNKSTKLVERSPFFMIQVRDGKIEIIMLGPDSGCPFAGITLPRHEVVKLANAVSVAFTNDGDFSLASKKMRPMTDGPITQETKEKVDRRLGVGACDSAKGEIVGKQRIVDIVPGAGIYTTDEWLQFSGGKEGYFGPCENQWRPTPIEVQPPTDKEIEAAALALCDLYGRDHSMAVQFRTRAEAALRAAGKVRDD